MNYVIQGEQPVFHRPVFQETQLRNNFVEKDAKQLKDQLIPKAYRQVTNHEIPIVDVAFVPKEVEIPCVKYVHKEVEVPVTVGYNPKFVPKWDVREVPRPVPKYEGEQQVIEVEVPMIQYVDKTVEKQIVLDEQKKMVPKTVYVEKEVPVTKYDYVPKEKQIDVIKYQPTFNIDIEIPDPLIVPHAQREIKRVIKTPTPNTSKDRAVILNPTGKPQSIPSHSHYIYSSAYGTRSSLIPSGTCAVPLDTKGLEELKLQLATRPVEKGVPQHALIEADVREQFENFPKLGALATKEANEENNENQGHIEYKGSVAQNPVYAGVLKPISFKLHAIEVHQFIPLPSHPTVPFLELLKNPSNRTSPNTARPDGNIVTNRPLSPDPNVVKSIFGSFPSGWVDPNITGMPAPIMGDLLRGIGPFSKKMISKIAV